MPHADRDFHENKKVARAATFKKYYQIKFTTVRVR